MELSSICCEQYNSFQYDLEMAMAFQLEENPDFFSPVIEPYLDPKGEEMYSNLEPNSPQIYTDRSDSCNNDYSCNDDDYPCDGEDHPCNGNADSPGQLIEEQNLEYEESLKEDKRRELEEERMKFLAERDLHIRKKYREEMAEKYIKNDESDFNILFKFPDQKRKNYKFNKADTVQQLYEFAAGQMGDSPLFEIKSFVLETPYPKEILEDKTLTLEKTNLQSRSVVLVRGE